MINIKKNYNKTKGITLISLIVTIIILLILSGVAISQITGENGLFTRAKQAKLETKRSQVIEFLSLKLIEEQGTEETLTENEILEKTKQNIIDDKQNLEKIVKKLEEVGEIETEEDGEKVNPYFYVTADKDVYKVEIAGVKFIGELGKFAPTIKIISLKSESNSITIEVKTGRKGNGKIEYYIKEEGEAKYQLKETQSEERYVYNGLKQGKKYNIKVVVIAENKQKAEVEGEKTTGEVTNLEEGDIKFEYTVEGKEIEATKWTNKEVTVKAIPNIDIGNYKLQTSTDGENFEEKDNQIFKENGTMYVILTDGTNYGSSATATVTKIDKVLPSASIELNEKTVNTVESATATVNLVDNESGINIEKCKWIYNTTATAIGTNESSYTGGTFTSASQKLTLKSIASGIYYLHVLAIDNAENKKEIISNAIEVKEYWEEISQIAKIISNTSSINEDTEKVTVNVNGKNKTIKVGDISIVDGKRVRVLGFNHDELSNKLSYGSATITGKAGISFEYLDRVSAIGINDKGNNTDGWEATSLRTLVNGTIYNSLSIKGYIKEVKKEYIKTWTDANSITKCSDKLWLLSCGEIWDNGYAGGITRGYAKAIEGKQYKYYKMNLGSTAFDQETDVTKRIDGTSYVNWWLRSPEYAHNGNYCNVSTDGKASRNSAKYYLSVYPGFSI